MKKEKNRFNTQIDVAEKMPQFQSPSGKLKRELTLLSATAIVVGNMIGSGIFAAPQGLAASSTPLWTMLAWVITGIGSLLIALSFANLGTKYPESGGPVVYTQKAFGDATAFMVSFTFLIGLMIGNAAIITTLVRYLSEVFPIFGSSFPAFFVESAMLWGFTLINIRGVKGAGLVSQYALGIKIFALGLFIVIGIVGFDMANLFTVSEQVIETTGGSGFINTLPIAIGITLWSFIGIESAAMAGGEVVNPDKNIRKSTIYGTLLTILIYMIISFLAMGAMNQSDLSSQTAPLAEILNRITGTSFGGKFFAMCIVLGGIGSGSGWILTTGRAGYSMAKDGFFPKKFASVNEKTGTPIFALVTASIITNLFFLFSFIGLKQAFDYLIALASLTMMPAYIFSCFAEIKLLKMEEELTFWIFIKKSILPLLASVYVLYVIYAIGAEYALFTFILMLAGIPIYIFTNKKQSGGIVGN
ncbi:MAG: amino acid permease [Candidatus Cloacimonetes bacterium]|nr:amino acid permease [Candidatus Cloacimonadota bacterium]